MTTRFVIRIFCCCVRVSYHVSKNSDSSFRRGPAKGYIEGLEHRLHDAESLLLQVLPHVSTEQLQAATSSLANQDTHESGRDSPDRRSSPPVLNKKTGIEYWENFPLTSVAGIRRWQQDCEMHGASHTSNNSSSAAKADKLEPRDSSPASRALSGEAMRQKRSSLPGHSSAATFDGTGTANRLDDLFGMHDDRRPSPHAMSQRTPMQMAMNQQRNPWQNSMMHMATTTENDLPQQQMFTHVGYLNTSGTWSQHSNMDIDLSHHHDAPSHDSSCAVSSQTHSHLFW